MSCCISNCVYNENRNANFENISLYGFPKDHHLKLLWLEAIGMLECELRENSLLCSLHFHENDFVSEDNEKKLAAKAIPTLLINHRDDTSTELRVCRVCLSMESKMYSMWEYELHRVYELMVGVMVGTNDKLPKTLCWECANKLITMRDFKEKAVKSQTLLADRVNIKHILTVEDIKEIISKDTDKPKTYDVPILEEKVVEIKDIIKVEEHKGDEDEIVDYVNDESEVDFKMEDSEVNKTSDHSFSDSDNVELSELSTRVKKRKAKIKKEVTEVKKRKPRVKKEVEVKRDEESADVMDKYKATKVKRRVRSYDVSDSHFDTRKLTYEEQIEELQLRQKSASYLNSPFKCTVCFKGFKSPATHDLHVVRHSEKYGEFECPICKRRFKNSRHLRLHITSLHTEEFSCKSCMFVTRCRGIAIDHQKWHSGNTYECPHCPSKFGKFTSYMSHLRIKHSSKFVCELCGYTFVSKRGVEMHKAKRHKLQDSAQVKLEGPYCEECKIRFVSDEAYLRHLTQSSVHSSDNDPNRIRNDWGCKEQVGVVRRRRKKRAAGVIVQWGDNNEHKPKQMINCEQCGVQLDSYRMYSHHFRIVHPGMNRTKFARVAGNCMCEQCGKMFACKALLIDHMTSHTGEKRFKCDGCDKAFTNKNNLTVHQRVHGAEVPTYQCPYCEKQFHFYQNCNRHVKTVHKGVKQFHCEICGKEFTSAAGQRAHIDHVHHKKPRPKRVRVRAPPAFHD